MRKRFPAEKGFSILGCPCTRTVRVQAQQEKRQDEEAKTDRLGQARDRDLSEIRKNGIQHREGAVTPRDDGRAGDQVPRRRIGQGRGLPRHEQVRVQDGVHEAARLRALPVRREQTVQILPPV